MAEAKKATAKAIAKVAPAKETTVEAVKEAEAKKVEVKEEAKAPVKEAEPKKTAAKATVAAKTPAEAKKAAAKKTVKAAKTAEEKAPAKKAAAKAKVQEAVHFQFSGKSYTSEDLLKICRDVWKYDLNGKEEDFKTVELYVKPEENTTYYVINGNITGSFFI